LRLAELVTVEVEPAGLLAERLGIERDPTGLLATALIHPSYTPEFGAPSNQRLEFLGDAVLDLVIAEALYQANPGMDEGKMSKARIALVNETTLAELARSIDLGALLSMGRGADRAGDRDKPSALADAFEAVIGAIYLAHGLDVARSVLLELFEDRIVAAAENPGGSDFKSLLNEWAAIAGRGAVNYDVTFSGPDHDREFVATALVGGTEVGVGRGRSKKAAEAEAAKSAWEVLGDAGTA
jgi:ribonuclease III